MGVSFVTSDTKHRYEVESQASLCHVSLKGARSRNLGNFNTDRMVIELTKI